ncbi:hypothetical protein BJY04DRAFT_169854 [Aspergillus karnatakaensis]|uniref:uncharacterized protein n=1 Tax=Aspergillus karnatakaensis TaxID=1810916 RepID=UPI003CCCA4CC
MPSTIFPTWPHIVFAIFEPITLIGGWLCPILDLQRFIADQIPSATSELEVHATSYALAYQLSNVYGLLALVGMGVLNATSEPKVLRNYLIALAIADVGHIYVTHLAMGPELFFDLRGWNVLTWGNVGVTGFLLVNRLLYFLGVFGHAQSASGDSKKRI